MSNLVETLIKTCHLWLNATGDGPVEITLPQKTFLNLAADLEIYQPDETWRIALDRGPLSFGPPAEMDYPPHRKVRVGKEFVFTGGGCNLVVREGSP